MNAIQRMQKVALVGYFGLWPLLIAWYAWLAPSTHFSVTMALGFLLTPLVFPLPGLLRGSTYTYAWSSFVSMLYFIHGVGEAYSEPSQRVYALLEILLSCMWFFGAIFFVRNSKAQANKTSGLQ